MALRAWVSGAGCSLAVAASAWAAPQSAITPGAIAGARLGLPSASYERILGRPFYRSPLEGGFSVLHFGGRKVEVYFKGAANSGVAVATWNRHYRTAAGVGPCSSVAKLKAAYGGRLKPFRFQGMLSAYLLGPLVFTVENGKSVGVVALARTRTAIFIALNVTECS